MGTCCANEREPIPVTASTDYVTKGESPKLPDPSPTINRSHTVEALGVARKAKSQLLTPQRTFDQGQTHSRKSSIGSVHSAAAVDFATIRTMKGTEEVVGLSIKKLSRSITSYYTITNELHRDETTTVRLAVHILTKKERVIKQVQKSTWKNRYANSRSPEELFRLEVIMLSKLDHPNIIKICELYEDRTHFYIVSEALTGGPLIDYLTVAKTLSEQLAANVISQVMHALAYCHSRGIVHKNLQMDSLILQSAPKNDNVHVILTGFGSAGLLTLQEKLTRHMTSVHFVAPETLFTECSEKSDIWSCGVILHMLLTGEPPFTGPNDAAVLRKIANDKVSFPAERWEGISTEAIHLVRAMLTKEPAERLSLAEGLNHGWIQTFLSFFVSFFLENAAQQTLSLLLALQLFGVVICKK